MPMTPIQKSYADPIYNINVTDKTVRNLLIEQYPHLADLPIALFASGWDNFVFRLGDNLCVRLPRKAHSANMILKEQRWLPELQNHLPLPVPSPIHIGRPSEVFPWPWSILPWFRGLPADLDGLTADQIEIWVRFLRSLHIPAPRDAPQSPVRGCRLVNRVAAMEERLARLHGKTCLINEHIMSIWDEAVASPVDVEMSWIHGDLHAGNVLIDGGRLVGIIDWGDMSQGDRATDLASIWTMFSDINDRKKVIDAYDLSSEYTWKRARGWAVLFGIWFVDTSVMNDSRLVAMGEQTLRHLLEGP